MSRTPATLSKGVGISYDLSIGVICQIFPRSKVQDILKYNCKESQRKRNFPAEIVVYFVISMCMFMTVSLREVLRNLMEGLGSVFPDEHIKVIGKSSISQARSRLGVEPLRQLHDQCVGPIGTPRTPGCFYKHWRITSLDATTFDTADEPSNLEAFGKLKGKNNTTSPYPQMRAVCLVENGTHVLFGSRVAGVNVGESTIAKDVIKESLQPDMLCLADRQFFGFDLWSIAISKGAALVWRMRSCSKLKVEEILPDGSYLSRVCNRPGNISCSHVVRVIEYTVEGSCEQYRLITNVLEHTLAHAEDLARLYAERWEIETVFDEVKTHLRGAHVCLRSKTSELAIQEFYGLMLAHFALRWLMHKAAVRAGEDPDRLSYTHTLNVVKRKIGILRNFSPSADITDVA